MFSFLKSKLNFKLISFVLAIFIISNLILAGCIIPKKQPARAGILPCAIVADSALTTKHTIWQTIWENVKWIATKAQEAWHSAGTWITATLGLTKETKDWIAKAIRIAAYILMHQIMNMITNDIINWINGGGKPRFISDWKGFLTTAADRAAGAFLNQLAGINLCEPFKLDLQIALMPTTNFPEEVSCSFSEMGKFFDDFRDGGWKGWAKITSPENNFFGAYFKGIDQRMSAEAAAEKAAENEGIASKGFLGVRCTPEMATGGKCEAGDIITPGDAISYTTNNAINQPMEDLSRSMADLTDSLGEFAPYVIAIGNALINKVIKNGLALVAGTNVAETAPGPANIPKPDASTATQMLEDKTYGKTLSDQQTAYLSTINNDIFPAQNKSLSVLTDIANTEKQILAAIIDAKNKNINTSVSFTLSPDPAKKTTTITTTNGNITTTIKTEYLILSATNIGTADVEKTTTTKVTTDESTITTTTIVYAIIKSSTKSEKKAQDMQAEIDKSGQLITSISKAQEAVDTYVGWLESYGDDLSKTQSEIDALSPAEKDDFEALKTEGNEYRLEAVILSQDLINSTSADFSTLAQETQQVILNVSNALTTILTNLGADSGEYSIGLYKDLYDAKKVLADIQNQIAVASTPTNN